MKYNYLKKIRVCHIASGDLWAGAEVQIATTLKHLMNSKMLSLSAVVLNDGMLADRLSKLNIPVYVIDEKKNSFLSTYLKVAKIIKRIRPHIIHSHRYKENLLAVFLNTPGRELIKMRTQHTTFLPVHSSESIKMQLYRLIDRITARISSDKIIAVSAAINAQICNYIVPDKTVIINNFVNIEDISLTSEGQIREEFACHDCFLIGSVGRLVEIKGLMFLIKAAKIVCRETEDVKFIIVGSGPQYDTLSRMIDDYELKDRVILTGFRNDVLTIMKTLDILIMPSLYEGTPMALLEAMALKRTIVASNVGGIPEIIQNGKNGLLIEPSSEKAIQEACIYLYRNNNVRKALAENALMSVKDNFNALRKTEQLISLYKQMAYNKFTDFQIEEKAKASNVK